MRAGYSSAFGDSPNAGRAGRCIAEWAIDHFTVRGLHHFAYCGDARFAWSVKRGERFAADRQERGTPLHQFRMDPSGTLADDRVRMAAFEALGGSTDLSVQGFVEVWQQYCWVLNFG